VKIGDVVIQKVTGLKMTVKEVGDLIVCQWFDEEEQLHESGFRPSVLRAVDSMKELKIGKELQAAIDKAQECQAKLEYAQDQFTKAKEAETQAMELARVAEHELASMVEPGFYLLPDGRVMIRHREFDGVRFHQPTQITE